MPLKSKNPEEVAGVLRVAARLLYSHGEDCWLDRESSDYWRDVGYRAYVSLSKRLDELSYEVLGKEQPPQPPVTAGLVNILKQYNFEGLLEAPDVEPFRYALQEGRSRQPQR